MHEYWYRSPLSSLAVICDWESSFRTDKVSRRQSDVNLRELHLIEECVCLHSVIFHPCGALYMSNLYSHGGFEALQMRMSK